MQRKPWKSTPALFVAILLVGALVLSACGSGNNPTPTAVATPLVENTTTPLVENTPTSEAGTTETLTDTGTLSPTETLTSPGAITSTEEISPSETMTETTGASATETMTTTDEITGTETTTGTDSVSPMETVTATEEISPSATMTATGSSASGSSATTDTGTISGTTGSSAGVSGAEGMLIRSSTLSGYDFVNEDGQVSGNIADYLVDVSTGNILFAFVEYGGLLDIGDKNLVMPLNAFRMGDGQLILNFNEQELQNFPDVGDNWPDVSTPDWNSAVSNFWSNLGINPGVSVTASSPVTATGSTTATSGSSVMWLKDMTGYALADLGSGAGTIQDTLIDLSRSRIKYILFDFGTATGTDQNPYIIPYSALDVQNMGNNQIAFNSNIDATVLQTAPRYDVNLYPNDQVLPQDFSTEIDKYWADHGITDSANQ
ncbi:MAG: PRC-barrel domain-containing protein [Caldilineaceae bacterium]